MARKKPEPKVPKKPRERAREDFLAAVIKEAGPTFPAKVRAALRRRRQGR